MTASVKSGKAVRNRPALKQQRGAKPGTRSAAKASSRPRRTPAAAAAPATVNLTHPERIVYPRDGITKQDIASYFMAVAEPLLAAAAGRPTTLQRWPSGIDAPSWFQQDIGRDRKPWMQIAATPASTGRDVAHLVLDSPTALAWLAQFSALTFHVWLSRVGTLHSPDWVVFDFDPADGSGIEQAIEPALVLRKLLDRLSLPSIAKTSGQDGLHVIVPLAAGHTYEETLAFAEKLGQVVTRLLPSVTVERAKSERKGRLYLDCMQNSYGKTIVAPYALRVRDGAPVSTPLDWKEVTPKLDPSQFNLRTLPARLDRVGDLFAPALKGTARLPKGELALDDKL